MELVIWVNSAAGEYHLHLIVSEAKDALHSSQFVGALSHNKSISTTISRYSFWFYNWIMLLVNDEVWLLSAPCIALRFNQAWPSSRFLLHSCITKEHQFLSQDITTMSLSALLNVVIVNNFLFFLSPKADCNAIKFRFGCSPKAEIVGRTWFSPSKTTISSHFQLCCKRKQNEKKHHLSKNKISGKYFFYFAKSTLYYSN